MWEWKAENQELTNNNYTVIESGWNRSTTTKYNIEDELSTHEKSVIIDKFMDGNFSYFIALNKMYMEAKEDGTIKLDSCGYAKEVSKKAWIRKHDDRLVFWNGRSKDNMWTNDYLSTFGYHNFLYFGYEVADKKIDEVFHYLCRDLANKEKAWFCEHDEYEILKTKFRECGCPCFGVRISTCSDGSISVYDGLEHDNWKDGRRDIAIDELKILLGKYEQLKAYEAELTKEVNIQF